MAMAALKGNQSGAMGSVMAYMTMAHSFGMLSGALLGGMMMDLFQLDTFNRNGWTTSPEYALWLMLCTKGVEYKR